MGYMFVIPSQGFNSPFPPLIGAKCSWKYNSFYL